MMRHLILFFLLTFFLLPAYANAETFFVNKDFDAEGKETINASLEISGENAYFFVDEEYLARLPENEVLRLKSIIYNLSTEFDEVIYSGLRKVFGEESNPGIDGDRRISVLLHNMKSGVGGYVRESDFNPGIMSNSREMIYLNIEEAINTEFGPSFLAHEFQHLINYNEKTIKRGVKEDQWLNEARSEYAPTLLEYNADYKDSYLSKRVNEFLAHPSDALLDWRGRSVDHASASMFIHYLVDRYGEEIVTYMMQANSVGAGSIDMAILALGHNESFSDVFRDWLITVYVNSMVEGTNENFKYKNTNLSFGNLHVLPSSTARIYDNNSSLSSMSIDNWSGQWYRFVPGSIGEEADLHIKVSSSNLKNISIPYIVSDFFGNTEVKFLDTSSSSIITVGKFGKLISSVVIIPTLMIEGKDNISHTSDVSFEVFLSNSVATRFSDGVLVRANDSEEVYIVKNGSKIGQIFKRWIQTEEVFGFYGHLKWGDVIELKPDFLSAFDESFLIRRAGDYKVYEADKSGNKKWLDMTPEEFEARGYSWDAVYEVNEQEFNWY